MPERRIGLCYNSTAGEDAQIFAPHFPGGPFVREGGRLRKLSSVTLGLFGFVVLSGCGGGFQGSLTGRNPDGGAPSPSSGQPVVNSLSPSVVTAGGADFTLTITGKNFAPEDSVEWDAVVLTSKYISSTQMTAQIPSSLITRPTTASIVVQRPVHDSLTFGAAITINAPAVKSTGFSISSVNIEANDMTWDPVSQQLYLSIAGSDLTHPNTIASLNPVTRQFGAFVDAGTGANQLAISSDSSWLYAGIDKVGSVQRYVLPGLTGDLNVPLGSDSAGSAYTALALEAAPGNPNTIAISRVTSLIRNGGVAVYDGATARPSIVSGNLVYPFESLTWNRDGSTIYASTSLDDVFTLSVDTGGVQQTQFDQLNTSSQAVLALSHIHYSALTGYVYGDNGQIFNPASGQVSWLPENVIDVVTGTNYPITIDDDLGIAWIVRATLSTPTSNGHPVILAFDLRTNTFLAYIEVPNVVGTPIKLVRWGSNGLAFLTTSWNNPLQGDGVYIVSGPFVTNPSAN